MSHPKRIIAMLANAMPISAARSVMPVTSPMRTIISVDDREYSTQRKRLRPRSSSPT